MHKKYLATMIISPTNATDAIFSSKTGMMYGLKSGARYGHWDAATVAACLIALDKPPALLEAQPWRWRVWIINHYRWVIWKLAAVSRQFFRNRLTFEHIVAHLKRRFECEFELSIHSALRAMCLRERSAADPVVLVISQIIGKNAEGRVLVELTDGWYCIHGLLDAQLASRSACGQVQVGTKLATQGAGVLAKCAIDLIHQPFCHNLVPPALLNLDFNGTKLARSSAKLGYHKKCRILATHLFNTGGALPAFDAVVQRISLYSEYPHTVIWLLVPDKPGSPILAELQYNFCLQFLEGDEIRVHHCIAMSGCIGSFRLKSTNRTHCEVKQSPASRSMLAACCYTARAILNGAMLARLGQNRSSIGHRVDTIGLVVATQENSRCTTIVLCDKSPNIIYVTVRSDFKLHHPKDLAGVEEGAQIAILGAILIRTCDNAAVLRCDELTVACLGNNESAAKVGFQDSWQALEKWANTISTVSLMCRAEVQLYEHYELLA